MPSLPVLRFDSVGRGKGAFVPGFRQSTDPRCAQNEVEAVAQKSPKQLTELLERISGSEELKKDYEEFSEEKNVASQVNYRGLIFAKECIVR
jgi:hypothetical protein